MSKIKYSNQELLKILKDYNDNIGIPTQRKFKEKFGLPSYSLYISRFGSFKNAMELAGLKMRESYANREKLSDNEMIKRFKIYVDEHLKTNIFLPTHGDFDNNKIYPTLDTYVTRFKSIQNIYKLIGYDYSKYNHEAKIKDMKEKYLEICNILGHVANSREVNDFSKNNKYYYCMSAYINNFGSLHNLQRILNLDLSSREIKTKEEMLKDLIKLEKELERIPRQKDVDECKYTNNSGTYIKKFGSFLTAIELIGHKNIRKERKQYLTKNGVICLSYYEYCMCSMLEDKNIKHTKEEYYANYIKGFKNKYRFDFVIEIDKEKYFIEIFGIEGNKKYDEKTKEKIKICKNNKINLIPLYPNDFSNYNIDYLYHLLIDKIEKRKLYER